MFSWNEFKNVCQIKRFLFRPVRIFPMLNQPYPNHIVIQCILVIFALNIVTTEKPVRNWRFCIKPTETCFGCFYIILCPFSIHSTTTPSFDLRQKSFNPHTIPYMPVSQMQSFPDKDYNIVCKPSWTDASSHRPCGTSRPDIRATDHALGLDIVWPHLAGEDLHHDDGLILLIPLRMIFSSDRAVSAFQTGSIAPDWCQISA